MVRVLGPDHPDALNNLARWRGRAEGSGKDLPWREDQRPVSVPETVSSGTGDDQDAEGPE
ncbi:hypothetical protein FMEAI12_2130003 [Parafrankia sp. Ea1.12]|nr:hypothetical protein FMEAI12_2130003 [Parafrankia sp. Ea1.12]